MEHSISEKIQSISPSPTLSIDAKFKSMVAEGLDVIGFGAGQPDFDTPEHVKEAAIQAIRDGFTKYTPASGTLELKKAICKKLARDNALSYVPEEIVVSNGAKHSLVNAFMALCQPGDEVIIPAPFWVSYPEMVKIADGVPVSLPTREENQFKFTVSDLEQVVTPKTKALVLNSPSNPTGSLYSREELQEIADFVVAHNLYVVSDEIYEKLVYDGNVHVSIASLNDAIRERTIVVNGLSKSHAMTGWRIGYTAAPKVISKAMANLQSHATSNPNSIAQVAAVTALEGDQSCVDAMRAAFVKRRDYMVDTINQMPSVSCTKPGGAFYVMMNIEQVLGKTLYGVPMKDVETFCECLLDRAKVAVVPGSGFAADNYVRLSYATSMEQIQEGLNRINKFLQEKE